MSSSFISPSITNEETVSPACCRAIIMIAFLLLFSSRSDEMYTIGTTFLRGLTPMYFTLNLMRKFVRGERTVI